MSLESAQKIVSKLVSNGLRFLFLQLLLWSTFLQPSIDVDIEWVPKSFFFSTKQSKCIIRLHHAPMAIFESSFFAAVALLGYQYNKAGLDKEAFGVYASTLATFEQSMMGVKQKYCWMCFVPWIITFAQNWLQNAGVFLMLLAADDVYEANDVISTMMILMLFFLVQALLASEVMCLALQGWQTMRNINNENLMWEQRKCILLGSKI